MSILNPKYGPTTSNTTGTRGVATHGTDFSVLLCNDWLAIHRECSLTVFAHYRSTTRDLSFFFVKIHNFVLVQQIKSVYGRIFQFVMQASNLVHFLSKHN